MGGLRHGNALAVHGDNQNRSGRLGREGAALGVEGIEVLGRFWKDLFEAAYRDGQIGDFLNTFGGFAERALNGGLDHTFLEFVGKRARR
jgi:hypothetical protein